jgi:hypothetical protein
MTAETYSKVPFEWTANTAPPDDPLRDGVCWLSGSGVPKPVELVADVLANSPGPEDSHGVEVLGAERAAQRTLALATGFGYLPDRWHVLMVEAHSAGFVLPVVYEGCSRAGLDEATIYHMGVARLIAVLVSDGYCSAAPLACSLATAFGASSATRQRPTSR